MSNIVVVLDTETADFIPKSKLTLEDAQKLGYESLDDLPICFQLSYLIEKGSGNRRLIRDCLGKPPIDISISCSEITNMVQSELEKLTIKEDGSFITIQETNEFKELKDLVENTNKDELYIVGHNIPFDVDVLKREGLDLSKCKLIDTLQLSKRFDKDLEFNRLHYLLYGKENIYNIVQTITSNDKIVDIAKVKPLTPHNSLYDVCITNTLLQEYKSLVLEMDGVDEKNVCEKLYELSNTPFEIDVVPFGFNKGKQISELDTSSILWFMKQDITEINFKYTLEKELDKRGGIKQILSKLSDYEANKLLTNIESESFKNLLENRHNVEIENKVITLGFGKHKDTNIQDVDSSYLEWVQKNNTNPTILSIISTELNRRKENLNVNEQTTKTSEKEDVDKTLKSNALEDFLNS